MRVRAYCRVGEQRQPQHCRSFETVTREAPANLFNGFSYNSAFNGTSSPGRITGPFLDQSMSDVPVRGRPIPYRRRQGATSTLSATHAAVRPCPGHRKFPPRASVRFTGPPTALACPRGEPCAAMALCTNRIHGTLVLVSKFF
jgi:hypothetical protein